MMCEAEQQQQPETRSRRGILGTAATMAGGNGSLRRASRLRLRLASKRNEPSVSVGNSAAMRNGEDATG
jgi:hypothetical protein